MIVPLRDRQVALQLLLELCIQQGGLHCALQTVQLLLELWDTGETEPDNRSATRSTTAPLIPALRRWSLVRRLSLQPHWLAFRSF